MHNDGIQRIVRNSRSLPGPGRTGPDREEDNPIPNTLCPENKKPYVSLIHKDLLSAALFSYVSRVEEGARTCDYLPLYINVL